MQRQYKHDNIIADIDRTKRVELALSVDASSLMQSIPEVPSVRHRSALEHKAQAVGEQSDDMDPDERPDRSSKPYAYGSFSPDAEVELENADSSHHDQGCV